MGLILWLSPFQAFPVSLILKLQMPHKNHHHRVLSRIFYNHCCATYRCNTWYAPPGKFRFKFLRNSLQQPCFCTWKDNSLTRGLGSNVQIQYCKILKMSPRAYIFQKLFLRGLSTEGNLRFKFDSASLIVGGKFTVFALFSLYLRTIFQVQAPSRLIFGGAI